MKKIDEKILNLFWNSNGNGEVEEHVYVESTGVVVGLLKALHRVRNDGVHSLNLKESLHEKLGLKSNDDKFTAKELDKAIDKILKEFEKIQP